MNMYLPEHHTFVVCAYKESPYLEECILSLEKQTVRTNMIISTSTPNGHISSIAEKHGLRVFVNHGEAGIDGDWNFAVSCVDTPLVTIAHQDDIYEPEYAEKMLEGANANSDMIICFSHYAELRNGQKVCTDKLLKIKKLMLAPLKIFKRSIFVRRRILSFGDPICCPAVTYKLSILQKHPFSKGFKSDLDWEQWEILSREKGSFVYISKPLMCHRIHEASATSEIIGDNLRTKEDYEMFRKFWGKGMAKLLASAYSSSEKSNDVKK